MYRGTLCADSGMSQRETHCRSLSISPEPSMKLFWRDDNNFHYKYLDSTSSSGRLYCTMPRTTEEITAQVQSTLDKLEPLLNRTDADPRPVVLMTCGIAGPSQAFPLPNIPSSHQQSRSRQAPANPHSPKPSLPDIHASSASPSTPSSPPATDSTGRTMPLQSTKTTRTKRTPLSWRTCSPP